MKNDLKFVFYIGKVTRLTASLDMSEAETIPVSKIAKCIQRGPWRKRTFSDLVRYQLYRAGRGLHQHDQRALPPMWIIRWLHTSTLGNDSSEHRLELYPMTFGTWKARYLVQMASACDIRCPCVSWRTSCPGPRWPLGFSNTHNRHRVCWTPWNLTDYLSSH